MVIEEQYRTTYADDFSVKHREISVPPAGSPTVITSTNSNRISVSPLPGQPPICPKTQSLPSSPSGRARLSGTPRMFETTYAGAFNDANSTKSPFHKAGLRAEAGKLWFPCPKSPKSEGFTFSESALHNFAAVNTFRTTYAERFADSSSVRALVSPKACVDNEFRTGPTYGRPAWGVSERPPPYLPGPKWTFDAEEAPAAMNDRPVTETAFQYRTRTHEVLCSDAMLDATKKTPGTARRYNLFKTGHAPDRRHDFFSLEAKRIQKKAEEEAQDTASHNATAALFPMKRPDAKDMFCITREPESLVLKEELQGERRAGLDVFSESVRKFEPNKARVDPGIPYCKPWQPLCTLHYDVAPQQFPFPAPKPMASQGFIPVTPTARFDGKMAGLRRKGLQE